MDVERVRALGGEVFERYRAGDRLGVRGAARAYRAALDRQDPDELCLLTADVEGLDLEVTATLADEGVLERSDALDQADALFARYARRVEPDLPATAAFALWIRASLLANARRYDEVVEAADQLGEFFAAREDAGRQSVIARHLIDVAYIVMNSVGGFDPAIRLLSAVAARARLLNTQADREVWAHAQVLLVVAILHSGDTSPLPQALRDLHSGGQDALAAINSRLLKWAGSPAWAGARVSLLGNKLVILDALGNAPAAEKAHLALSVELEELGMKADADQIVGEIQAALLA